MLTPKESPKACGHDKFFPCDCESPACICSTAGPGDDAVCTYGDHGQRIWGHRVRSANGEFWAGNTTPESGHRRTWAIYCRRAHAHQASRYTGADGYECGPVQRVTEPPHVFVPQPEKRPYAPPTLRKLDGDDERVKEISKTAMTRDLDWADSTTCLDCGAQPARGGFCGDGYCNLVEPRHITVSQAGLARLLFTGSTEMRRRAWKHAEIDGEFDSHPLGESERVRMHRVLDGMWNGAELERREMAEQMAAGAFRAARERK
jgi:hypothetical protein